MSVYAVHMQYTFSNADEESMEQYSCILVTEFLSTKSIMTTL